jgi:TRAP-type C4-dicarboxylate transport system permease small subunit
MLRRVGRAAHRVADAVAAALLAVIFVAFLAQIVMRYVFNWPVGWTTEVSLMAWLWLVLWGAAVVLKDHEEIRLDLLTEHAGPRVGRVATIIGSIGIIVLFAISLPATWSYVSFMKVEKSSYLKIPMDYVYSIYMLFAVAVIVRSLLTLVRAVRGEPSPSGAVVPNQP